MAKRGIFDFDTLTPGLKELLPRIDAAVDIVFDSYEARAETWMRENAPWTDRTGNARNGLQAKHESEPMVEHRLVMYHTMPYGYWLEVRWSGKYAIVGPTMFHISPELTQQLTVAVAAAAKK